MRMATKWESDVCHLLHVCHVYFEARKKVLGCAVFFKLSLELPCICVVVDGDSEGGSV
jgi:hypothetical protein